MIQGISMCYKWSCHPICSIEIALSASLCGTESEGAETQRDIVIHWKWIRLLTVEPFAIFWSHEGKDKLVTASSDG